MKKIIGLLFIFVLALMPTQIFAHGTEEEHQKEIIFSHYIFIGFVALFIILFILLITIKYKVKQLNNVKKQEDRRNRQKLKKISKVIMWATILSLVGVLISCMIYLTDKGTSSVEEITIKHAHGMDYSSDGSRILFAAHDGLRKYEGGRWTIPDVPQHDYMGFSMVDDGFYSSGHPARGSNLKDPLGIVKSTDDGKTLEMLALYGKVDFHSMDVSYDTHTIYVLNPQPNTLMETTGLHYSQDEAKTWTKSEMEGYTGESTSLAVHPTNDAIVAVGTQAGLYLSKDHGHQFEKILSDRGVTSISFGYQGQLFVGGYNNGASLLEINIETKQTNETAVPITEGDAVSFLAQNPAEDKEIVLMTYNKDIYLSDDAGMSWNKIANQGVVINQTKE